MSGCSNSRLSLGVTRRTLFIHCGRVGLHPFQQDFNDPQPPLVDVPSLVAALKLDHHARHFEVRTAAQGTGDDLFVIAGKPRGVWTPRSGLAAV